LTFVEGCAGLDFFPGGGNRAGSACSFCGGCRQLDAAETLVATVETLLTLLLLNRVNADDAVVPPEMELAELDVRQLLELAPEVDCGVWRPRVLFGDDPRSSRFSKPLSADELRLASPPQRSNWAVFDVGSGGAFGSGRQGDEPRARGSFRRPRAHGSDLGGGGAGSRPMMRVLTLCAVADGFSWGVAGGVGRGRCAGSGSGNGATGGG